MAAVFESSVGPASTRLVLLALAHGANDEGEWAPTIGEIAGKAGVGASTTRQAVAELERDGLLVRQHREGCNSAYRIVVEALSSRAGRREAVKRPKTTPAAVTPPEAAPVTPPDSGGVQDQGGVEDWALLPVPDTEVPAARKGKTPRKAARASDGDPEGFAEFWAIYPKKKGRLTAVRAFRAAAKKATLEQLIDGLRRYVDEREGEDPQFTKQAATWLNGGHWEDEPTPRPNLQVIRGHQAWHDPADDSVYEERL